MSPTQFAVRNAELENQLKIAWADNDLKRIQAIARQRTVLLRAIYGQLA